MDRTDSKIDKQLTNPRSADVRGYELVSYRGEIFGPYSTVAAAAKAAQAKWPDQTQDEDRTGKGWDIQLATRNAR